MSGGLGGRIATAFFGLLLAMLLGPPIAGLAVAVSELVRGGAESPATLGYRGWSAGWTTVAWAIGVGLVASASGLAPGRRLARHGRAVDAVLWSVPVLLAPAILFDAWWLEAGPDSLVGAWAADRDSVPLLRETVLALGLLTWALPLAVWAHASIGDDPSRSLRLIDSPMGARRIATWFRIDGPPIGRVAVLVAIVIGGLTVPFDLAQVRSIGFELRTLDTRGATMGTLLRAGWWSVPLAILGATMLMWRLRGDRRFGDRSRAIAERDAAGRWGVAIGVVLVVAPLLLLLRRAGEVDLASAWRLHGPAAIGTLEVGVAGGLIGGLVACGCVLLRAGGRRSGDLALLAVGGCAVVCLLPATLVAAGVESVWNRPVTTAVYDGPVAMILAVTGRIVVVPAILGCVLVPRVGVVGGGPCELDAPRRFADLVTAGRPTLVRAALAGSLAGAVLAAGEIPVTARLQPPGFPLLPTSLLNAMHYQYVDSVLPVVLPVSLAAIPAAMVLARIARRPLGRVAPALLALLVVVGCGGPVDDGEPPAAGPPMLVHHAIFGRPGNLEGRFDYPRAIAIDTPNRRLFVVDKSARVQRFGLDGTFQASWTMPRFANGKPTGISVAPDGRVIVADTHEHRIAIFSPEGDLLETHGRMGRGPGEFIYPTDVAAGPDGRWFVSEYGGNDRIQIFDADWRPQGVIGFAGETDQDERPALSRPQSIAWDAERGELFIADAIHHRIVVTDADGRLRRVLGGPGHEPGRLAYPYGIGIHEDGSLLVVEFGGNRVQRLDPIDGRSLAVAGGTGVEPGRLRYPWAIDVSEGTMAILDSGNARVLVADPPEIGTGITTHDPSAATVEDPPRDRDPSPS